MSHCNLLLALTLMDMYACAVGSTTVTLLLRACKFFFFFFTFHSTKSLMLNLLLFFFCNSTETHRTEGPVGGRVGECWADCAGEK